jgi:hypothetical protein
MTSAGSGDTTSAGSGVDEARPAASARRPTATLQAGLAAEREENDATRRRHDARAPSDEAAKHASVRTMGRNAAYPADLKSSSASAGWSGV